MKELITVIVNVYNGEKFIKKCLDSIINQTYKNLEIIIVNDGSTDNTLSICESYQDKRIKIINQENLGLSLARNVGIEAAKGEYLYFVDADDFIELDTIEYLYNLCKKYNVYIATSKALIINNYNFEPKNEKEQISIISNKEMLKDILLLRNKAVCSWNKLVKAELYNNLRFEDRIMNDIAFTHKLIMKVNKIAFSNLYKYYYLRNTESITAKKASTDRLIDMYNVYSERYNYINEKYPEFAENNLAVLKIIIELYLKNNKEIEKYLEENNAIKLYKKIFTFKILKCNIGIREKIKIILFRISPKLNKLIVNVYIRLKGKK